jgi:hypothetical protein
MDSESLYALRPEESDLVGAWIVINGRMEGDTTCKRIDWLLQHHLRKIATDPKSGGWTTLFQDPNDGRFWERTFPHGEMQGGGPHRLALLSTDEVRIRYQLP